MELDSLLSAVLQQIEDVADLPSLDDIRVQYLGKKGALTAILKTLSSLSPDERPRAGQQVNDVKDKINTAIKTKIALIQGELLEREILKEAIDITLPGRGQKLGGLHPVTKVRQRLVEIFATMGFFVVEGPEIEDEFHNFTALNIPKHHPARNTTDTFYLEDSDFLLRTQTSPVQIRAMEKYGVPLRIIAPGKVYRRDSDATHVPMFHQLEGLIVDENITFSNLKYILNNILEAFFEQKIKLRFRPSYFPFTEPSAEVDLQCVKCGGKGCNLCGSGWIEVLGCGMVHPNALKSAGVDSARYTGIAFGIGMDRFAMFRYGIHDLRMLFDNDLRFLENF